MRIEIPGYKTMELKYLILDYNGTIAKDGIIPESVKERLKKLSGIYEIYVLTADTHGTARKICEGLPLKIQTFPGNAAAEEKRKIIEQLGGIIEAEGAYGRLIANVDICTRSIEEALDVLAMPKRMVATLRG